MQFIAAVLTEEQVKALIPHLPEDQPYIMNAVPESTLCDMNFWETISFVVQISFLRYYREKRDNAENQDRVDTLRGRELHEGNQNHSDTQPG